MTCINLKFHVILEENTKTRCSLKLCIIRSPIRAVNSCEPEFNESATTTTEENGQNMPETYEEARNVYLELLHHIGNIQ